MTSEKAPSKRTRVERAPDEAVYDREAIERILDEALVAHVGFSTEHGPAVVPTAYWRTGDHIYFHGARTSRMVKALRSGEPCCVCVTLLDGLVLARSAYHHTMNYRSVVIYGRASEVTDPEARFQALRDFSERLAPGRWDEIRPPTAQEMKATTILALSIEEASAKVSSGPPQDDEADYALPVWAGVVPMALAVSDPEPDPCLPSDRPVPPHARHLQQRRAGKG